MDGKPSHSGAPIFRRFGCLQTLFEAYGPPLFGVLLLNERHWREPLHGGPSLCGAATARYMVRLRFALRVRNERLHGLISTGSAAFSRFNHCRARGIRSGCLWLWILIGRNHVDAKNWRRWRVAPGKSENAGWPMSWTRLCL